MIRELSQQTRAHRREEQEARQHGLQMLSAALLEVRQQITILTDTFRGQGVRDEERQRHTPPGSTGGSGARERTLRGLPRPRHRQNTTAQVSLIVGLTASLNHAPKGCHSPRHSLVIFPWR
jgi:hypothetical protein